MTGTVYELYVKVKRSKSTYFLPPLLTVMTEATCFLTIEVFAWLLSLNVSLVHYLQTNRYLYYQHSSASLILKDDYYSTTCINVSSCNKTTLNVCPRVFLHNSTRQIKLSDYSFHIKQAFADIICIVHHHLGGGWNLDGW